MAGLLDGGRMKAALVQEFSASPKDIETVVLGIHGDPMLALPRLCTYQGQPITEILAAEKISQIVDRTKTAAPKLLNY